MERAALLISKWKHSIRQGGRRRIITLDHIMTEAPSGDSRRHYGNEDPHLGGEEEGGGGGVGGGGGGGAPPLSPLS